MRIMITIFMIITTIHIKFFVQHSVFLAKGRSDFVHTELSHSDMLETVNH
jgi:hypothetical protein